MTLKTKRHVNKGRKNKSLQIFLKKFTVERLFISLTNTQKKLKKE